MRSKVNGLRPGRIFIGFICFDPKFSDDFSSDTVRCLGVRLSEPFLCKFSHRAFAFPRKGICSFWYCLVNSVHRTSSSTRLLQVETIETRMAYRQGIEDRLKIISENTPNLFHSRHPNAWSFQFQLDDLMAIAWHQPLDIAQLYIHSLQVISRRCRGWMPGKLTGSN